MTSKRRKWVIAAAIVALAITVVTLLTRDREPSYQGKSLSEWCPIYIQGADPDGPPDTTEAEAAIRHMGTNALPYLVKWLADDRQPVSQRMKLWLARYLPLRFIPGGGGLVYLTEYRSGDKVQFAAFAFQILDEQARHAVPDLARLLNTEPAGSLAANHAAYALALRAFGDKGIAVLTDHLSNTNARNRPLAANALRTPYWHHAPDPSVIKLLANCLNDPDPKLRIAATNFLRGTAPSVLTNALPRF